MIGGRGSSGIVCVWIFGMLSGIEMTVFNRDQYLYCDLY